MSAKHQGGQAKFLLGRRLTLVGIGITTLLAAIYLAAGVWFARIELEREFHQSAEVTAKTLASSLIEEIITHNLHDIPALLDNTQMSNPNILYGFVCDSKGIPVAHTRSFKKGVPGDLEQLSRKHAEGGGGHQSWSLGTESGEILHFALPLEGRPSSYLHLGFSLAQVDASLRETFWVLASSMLAGLLLSAVIGGLIYRRMAKPVRELTGAALELGAGNLERRVVTRQGADDEVALLAVTFNRMAEQLQEKLTELERSRSELADEKTRIKTILDGMLHGVVFYKLDGSVGYCNPAAMEHWGWNTSETPQDCESIHDSCFEALQAFKNIESGKENVSHARIRCKDRILDLIISGILNDKGEFIGIAEITYDASEQVSAERALAHAEKLNVIGQLAAGVAHEINSPLDGAIEAARIMQSDDLTREEIKNFASAQQSALERIAATVYRLLTFSRKERTQVESLSVWSVIMEAVEIIKYRLPARSLSLQLPGADEVPQIIKGESLELSQVIVNLLSNAIDASPDGGMIRIEVAQKPEWIEISVSDQGYGIPEILHDRIFTPFFTTKDVGKGTGLGLVVSKNIVESYGGRIDIRNEEAPWGARFSVHLPWDGSKIKENEKDGHKNLSFYENFKQPG